MDKTFALMYFVEGLENPWLVEEYEADSIEDCMECVIEKHPKAVFHKLAQVKPTVIEYPIS